MTLLSLFRKEPEKVLTKAQYVDIVDRLEVLERSGKGLRLEWEDAFQRVEGLLKRINGALAAVRKRDQQEEEPELEPRKSVAPEPFQRYASADELASHRNRRFGGLLR